MKKNTIIILAIMFLAACSKENMDINPGTSAQDGSNIQAAKATHAFNATLNAAADGISAPTPCSGIVPFAAPDFLLNGTVMHMGLLNATSRLHHVSCDVDVTTALLTTNVTVDLVAANGDVIHCTGNDVVDVSDLLLGQTSPTGSITGTWTIDGGTGRFTDATGSLTIDGTVDFTTFSFTCECVGTITY